MNRKFVDVGVILATLQILGEDFGEFLPSTRRGAPRRPSAPRWRIRRCATSWTGTARLEEPRRSPMYEQWLEEMNKLRYRDPVAAVEKLQAAAGDVPKEHDARFLAVLGSAYRNRAWSCRRAEVERDLTRAFESLEAGLWIARKLGARAEEGDLLQRLSYVERDLGEFEGALELAM